MNLSSSNRPGAAIGFEALDDGLAGCQNPKSAQGHCDRFSAEKIDRFFYKLLARPLGPTSTTELRTGYCYYGSSIEFSG